MNASKSVFFPRDTNASILSKSEYPPDTCWLLETIIVKAINCKDASPAFTVAEMATQTKMAEYRVRRSLGELEKLGFIERKKTPHHHYVRPLVYSQDLAMVLANKSEVMSSTSAESGVTSLEMPNSTRGGVMSSTSAIPIVPLPIKEPDGSNSNITHAHVQEKVTPPEVQEGLDVSSNEVGLVCSAIPNGLKEKDGKMAKGKIADSQDQRQDSQIAKGKDPLSKADFKEWLNSLWDYPLDSKIVDSWMDYEALYGNYKTTDYSHMRTYLQSKSDTDLANEKQFIKLIGLVKPKEHNKHYRSMLFKALSQGLQLTDANLASLKILTNFLDLEIVLDNWKLAIEAQAFVQDMNSTLTATMDERGHVTLKDIKDLLIYYKEVHLKAVNQ